MGRGEIEWAKLANQFYKNTSYQESLLMEHEVLNKTRGFRGNPNLMVIPLLSTSDRIVLLRGLYVCTGHRWNTV
ncbi:hypothetical protein AXF42_Ash005220 [Apostasia shenzhenica]|uniref:Uncharacterized protein n=1 Tax=Apostasia shenzhenica TaxID=1088818 RepID=A0A2I0B6B0_9ASPA|nr:hypothetical protein AXF42_Ash005220 [Apostasia shenzhenica]